MITGPELDLLQEVLAEDPASDVYLDVANALLDAGETRKAAAVLRRALEAGVQDLDTARMLAQAASEAGDDRGLRVAADALGEDVMRSEPALARAYAIALDRAGDLDRAGELAQSLLDAHGADAVLHAIVARRAAPLPASHIRANDPFFTVGRAEAYLETGRADLAVRAYRRILAANPEDEQVHARLLRLRAMPREARPWVDDLSEEYWVGRPMSAIAMPSPTLVPVNDSIDSDIMDDDMTEPAMGRREFGPGMPRSQASHLPPADPGPSFDDFEDEEATAVMSVDMLDQAVRTARRRGSSVPTPPRPTVPVYEEDEDEEATTVMRPDDPALKRARLMGRARSAIAADELEEPATVMMNNGERREMARRMPGVDDIRRAIEEDDDDDEVSGVAPDDADSIIEQARAIEQRAADRRRRSLFRK